MAIDTQELTDALEDAGFGVKPYSGRAMFGAECISIHIESESELWHLAYRLAERGVRVSAPKLDSMGRGLVAYWPAAKIVSA